MKRLDRKSDCAINYSLENIGDPWSLLIVRDIVYYGKKTFSEFLDSSERIGTNTLSRRLAELEKKGILAKKIDGTDKRKETYSLTDKGLDLIPLLFDLAEWGAAHDAKTGASAKWTATLKRRKEEVIKRTRKTVQKGGSVVVGPDAVIKQLKNS